MELFKEYDIRGIYGEELTPDFAYKLGRSIVIFLKCSDLIIARDGRLSSDIIHQHFCKGVMDQGCNVNDIGILSTPNFYFNIMRFQKPGVIITASHNSKEYNGFKIMDQNLNAVHLGNGLKDIKKLVENKNFQEPYKKGNFVHLSANKYYIEYLEKFFVDKDVSFVLDMSNGSGKVEADFLDGRYNNCIVINGDIDGNFPAHSPDPTNIESQVQLKKKILENNADFGVIFDGDADRAMFFDEKANMIRPEIVVSLFNLKEKVIYDVRSSQSLSRVCSEQDVDTFMVKAGRTNMVSDMKKHDAFIGVEGSGHYFFKEFGYVDSAILAVLKLIENLKTPLSEYVQKNTRYNHSGEINFQVKNRLKSIEKIRQEFNDAQTLNLDGYSFYLTDSWFNIRLSNTEPLIRLNAESKTKESLTVLINKIKAILKDEN
ncbi:MAG: phosphomannomutase/phosphoglucomutase [Candidatus Woesearchaeota archaeon]